MAQLHELIANVRRRWFAAVALRTIGRATFAAAIPAVAAVVVDALLAPQGLALMLLGTAAVLLSILSAAVVLAGVEPRPGDRRVARFVEERAALVPGSDSLEDTVVTAVDAANAGEDRAPISALIVSAAMRKLDGITPAHLVPSSVIRQALLLAVGGATALAVTFVVGWPSLTRAVETARLRWFPASVTVDVQPGDVRLVAGQPLKIRARLLAGEREFNQLQPQLLVTSGTEQRSVVMNRQGNAFEFDFESVDRSFTYRVVAAATKSVEYRVTTLSPPRVERIDLLYRYPSFSGLAEREEHDGGDIYAPAGTRVRVRVHADKAIASGQLTLGSGRVTLGGVEGRTADADLVLSRDDSYRIRLTDRDGLTSPGDSEYFIRLMDDRPPDVRILRPSGDQGITPLEEVTIEARADDDYGVSSLELVYSVGGGREHVVPFSAIAGTGIQKTGSHLLAAEDLKVRPGDVITYYARATDVGRGKRPTETKSDMFFLEVKPFSEEFVAAQSQAGGAQGGDPQIDSLIAAQKEIISATWNIERRSQGGRSAEDIAAIAKAQAELKERAERIAGGARPPRGREPFPQQVRPQPPSSRGSDGVAAAVEAMGRAAEQLGQQRTRDAITHEMAALNGLLQAQAEVRRRQVTQQASGSGSGGGNRSAQDLSALFDKELQRQQRTNYEQRSQVEERPDQRQGSSDALERIKDLARRQEELNQRQRELGQMSAEERKRQLEKLTRDQAELRQQAEDLARQMGQQQQQSSPGPASQQQNAGGGMRDAAEQMRAATNDMRRDNQGGAQQSGERAAEQLRRVEQQMRGASADSRRRDAGELQSEAQQIAQEQRRIAAEAERLEKAGASSADARQRLADEKERLAGRVEELRRAAEQAAAQGAKGQESGAREAAVEIQRERLAERMRESAKQTRNGATGAGGDRQIAQALDEVVDKLGGAASAEAKRLSDELDRAREMRERLERLEKQMAAAEGKNDGQLEKLRQQYDQELRRTRDALGRAAAAGEPRDGQGRSTPEQHDVSRSAPGTEAFKQDRTGWESLKRDVGRALEQHEAAISRRLVAKIAEAKLSAGGSDRVPEAYRPYIAKYYESLAKVKKER